MITLNLLKENTNFKTTEWMSRNKNPNEFILENAIFFSFRQSPEDVFSIHLLINNSPSNSLSKFSLSQFKKSSREMIFVEDTTKSKGPVNIVNYIIDNNIKYHENTKCDKDTFTPIENPIKLVIQDEELHANTVGESHDYSIVGVKCIHIKSPMKDFDSLNLIHN